MMDMRKFEGEVGFLYGAYRQATEKPALLLQLTANLVAALVLAIFGGFALRLLAGSPVSVVFGVMLGLLSVAVAGCILAAGAAAIMYRMFNPPTSSYYDSPWLTTRQFFDRNYFALGGGYGVFYLGFCVVACALLVFSAVARFGSVGQILYAILSVPLFVISAAGVLSLLVGISIVPAEVSLRERNFGRTISSVFGSTYNRMLDCLKSLAVAFVAAVLIAIPFFALLRMGYSALLFMAGVTGVTFSGFAFTLLLFFKVLLVAVAATLPMAFFNVVVGMKYNELTRPEEDEAYAA